jgi:hypothetical protein
MDLPRAEAITRKYDRLVDAIRRPDSGTRSDSSKAGDGTAPKPNYILSKLVDKDLPIAFSTYGVSDLWLPIPKQTLRRLISNSEGEKTFLKL